MYKYLGLLTLTISLQTQAQGLVEQNETSVAHDKTYYTKDVANTRLIFPKEHKQHAEHAAAVEAYLQQQYQQTFGFALDDTLYVGLMSSHNQIANGFATPYPVNRQINYMGGAQMVDYFAATSWLDTLLLHETAHNYQTTAKNNFVSKTLHKVLGNGSLMSPIIPSIHPNIFESSFILEGNAILNESWHGNGGRLYSGLYRAMTNVHAKAGYLTPERMYNSTLNFPYAEGFYIFGSQYQHYLAEQYGLDKVNKYFKMRSRHWYWPFMVNRPMRNTLGINFNDSLFAWQQKLRQDTQDMQFAKGKRVATSKQFSPMNRQAEQIIFLTNPDAVSAPVLNQFQISTAKLQTAKTSLALGKVFAIDDSFYTVSSRRTSVWRSQQGLFNDNATIKQNSEGKIVQGYLQDGRAVYFESSQSFEQPQLYVGDKFYAQVNSSVLVHQDNLYYFVQSGRERTLFKNNQALVSFTGHYGIVVDVDEQGHVYFIANSRYGSSLYRTNRGTIERVLTADNVIDAKLVNNQILVSAIAANEYYYALETPQVSQQTPFVVNLLWDKQSLTEQQPQVAVTELPDKKITDEKTYGLLNNLRFSGAHIALGSVTEENDKGEEEIKTLYNVQAIIADPLNRTQIGLWAMRDSDYSDLIGVRISNNQSFALLGLQAYYVANNGFDDVSETQTRDSGFAAQIKIPFLHTGFWRAEIDTNYYQDYKLNEREPLSVALNISRTEHYANSWLYNEAFAVSAYATEDRESKITGGQMLLATDLANEFYLQGKIKHSQSNLQSIDPLNRLGVELQDTYEFTNPDPSKFVLPSLKGDLFAKSVSFAEVSASKVFNFSWYSLKSPFSLRREKLALAFRHYDIEQANNLVDVKINQMVVGLDFDILLMNKLNLTLGLQYIYSDDDLITEQNKFQFGFNLPL
ncbi:outer membrane protein [Catenovulum agarivorans DS-2]|uniref:Outer membrane protein n=1 Tax=Catenovulum agarivorans DS-2 TaxID=1328313 RepID=W7QLT6_9ALTE|nr:membrane protein [Catenovulum agarivorans]EWH09058.1 outer membrane protein [Catenovulum agarivorans DS-2]